MARTQKPDRITTTPASAAQSSKSPRSKFLKMFGTGVLLFSFIAQWTIVRYSDSLQKGWAQAHIEYSRAYTDSLVYLVLYFTSAQATGKTQEDILQTAARQNAMGFSARLAVSDLTEVQRSQQIKEVLNRADDVKDLDSYNQYINYINGVESPIQARTAKQITDIHNFNLRSIWIFVVLYIIGTALQLAGMYYE
jgi:uncharacterized membrane protein